MRAPSRRFSLGVVLLAAVAPFLAIALWQLRAPLDLSLGDQAQYLIHARSMLQGRGYTDDGYIHYTPVPVSPVAYPPGLPLLIALVQGIGGSIGVLRVLMVLIATAYLYVAGRYLSVLDEEWGGPATALVCGLVPGLALYATGLYTDFAFSALVWTCCLLVDRPGHWSRGRIVALALCGAAAIGFRTAAIALIPALIAHQAWRAIRQHESRTRAIAPLVTWIAAYVALDHFFPATAGYVGQIGGAVGDGPAQHVYVVMGRLLVQRALDYRELATAFQLNPTPWAVPNAIYHVLAMLLTGLGLIVWTRRAGVRFLFCFAAFYLGMLLLMPWPSSRFLWPLLPMFWFATLAGGKEILARVGHDERRALRVTLAAAGLVAVSAVAFGPPAPRLVGIGDLREGRELYDAIRRLAGDSTLRLGFFNPRDAARLTGVSAMSIPTREPDELLGEFASHGVSHVVVGSMGTDERGDSAMRRALAERSSRFAKVFANDSFAIYRIMPEVRDPDAAVGR